MQEFVGVHQNGFNTKFRHLLRNKLAFKHKNLDSVNCDLDCLRQSFQLTPYFYGNPYPICYSTEHGFTEDPLLDLLQVKQSRKKKLEKIKSVHSAYVKKNSLKMYDCYKQIQELFDNDPDKYFNSSYNWYYTGGNLDTEEMMGELSVFHIMNGTKLCVSRLSRNDNSWCINHKAQLNDEESLIFHLETLRNDQTVFIYVRRKHNISLYSIKYKDQNQLVFKGITQNVNDLPFVFMNINKINGKEYVTVDVKHTVKIWDQANQKEKWKINIEHDGKDGNCFGQVFLNGDHNLAYINKNSFQLLDIRTADNRASLDSCNVETNDGDQFSNLCIGQNSEPYCYITTLEAVLQVDFRTMTPVSSWPHNFTITPHISAFISRNGTSNLCISSHKPDEKLFISYKESNTRCVPRTLPNLRTSFDSFLAKFPKTDQSLCIRDRLNASTSGLRLIECNDIFSVLSANTLGDVFCHEISETAPKIPDNVNFLDWHEKFVENRRDEQLNFVDKVFLKGLYLEVNKEPVCISDPIKEKKLKRCIKHLSNKDRGKNELVNKFSNVWFSNDNKPEVLDEMQALSPNRNIENWLINLPEEPEEN